MFRLKKVVIGLVLLSLLASTFLLGGAITAASKPYEITWYYIGNGPCKDQALVEQEVNKYLQKKKLNATLKMTVLDWGSYNDKMTVTIASGQPFDICFTTSWTNYYRQNVAKGAFLDITELWKKYAPKSRAQLHPAFISGSAIDGRNYAIPCNKELAHQWGFYVRKDIAAKYGFDLSTIKGFADLEPMLKVIKEKEPEMMPLQAVGGEHGLYTLDFDRPGDDGIPGVLYNDSKDMKIFNEYEAPETKAYLEIIRKYYLAGYIPKDAPTLTNFNEARRAGKVFIAIGSLKPLGDDETSANTGFPVVNVPITKPVVQTRDCTGSMMAISRTSKNPAMALKFLELFNTDKYLNNLINYGIEGVHYVKVSDNEINPAPGLTNQNSPYRPGIQWVLGNQYLNYFWKGSNTTKWDAFKKFNASALMAKSLGFNFDNEPVKTECAACLDVTKQYSNALMTGSVDYNVVLPEMLAKLKDAGVDKVMAEKQRQLDAWIAANGKKK